MKACQKDTKAKFTELPMAKSGTILAAVVVLDYNLQNKISILIQILKYTRRRESSSL